MNSKPRMLWVCPHLVLRYEEVPLFIEAGFEVIPSLGGSAYLAYDSQYDDETNDMYPNWRAHCTLPTNISDKIRKINLMKPTKEEMVFMNQWVDVIYVASFPEIVESVATWFKGIVIFRTFGQESETDYTKISHRHGVDLSIFAQSDRYVWCPILKSLSEREDQRLIGKTFYLPAFVSKERLPFEWVAEKSDRRISTVFSYIDHAKWMFKYFDSFVQAFKDFDIVVLGKNNKNMPDGKHSAILGNVSFQKFLSTICQSRIFCYCGISSPYHLHFTPLEVMTMGVPMLFLDSNGLAREALENGLTPKQLEELGMCKDNQIMSSRATSLIDNFSQLHDLRRRQHEILLPVFGRERALNEARTFLESIKHLLEQLHSSRTREETFPILYLSEPTRKNIINSKLFPSVVGEYRIYNCYNSQGDIGNYYKEPNGNYQGRKAVVLKDKPGVLLREHLTKIEQGVYEFELSIYFDSITYSNPGYFRLGTYVSGDYQQIAVVHLKTDVPGLVHFREKVVISDVLANFSHQLEIYWSGETSLTFVDLRVSKVSEEFPKEESTISLNWGHGFSVLENTHGEYWRWCAETGRLTITNYSQTEQMITCSMGVNTGYPEISSLKIQGSIFNDLVYVNNAEKKIKHSLSVPPGEHHITFSCNAKQIVSPTDIRTLIFRINNFMWSLAPISVEWAEGFYPLEVNAQSSWRWCQENGIVFVENKSGVNQFVNINADFITGYPECSNISITSPFWNEVISVDHLPCSIEGRFLIPPGKHAINFRSDAKRVESTHDTRTLVFRILNFNIRLL